jgi:hypothetical protein
MQEQKNSVATDIESADRAEWKRPAVIRLEADDAAGSLSGESQDAIFS